MILSKKTNHQENLLIQAEQRAKRIVPTLCCSVILLSGCTLKTDEIDYGEVGKLLTEEEVLSSIYLDQDAMDYRAGDQITLYSVKEGRVRYGIERSLTDQELKDQVNRYESIAGIFGRKYQIGVGLRTFEGETSKEGVSYFDFEIGNPTAVDYLKTIVVNRQQPETILTEMEDTKEEQETLSSIPSQELEAIAVEFAFTIQEGNGLFEINQYPAVVELLNAVREVNLTEDEMKQINEKVQEVMMNAMLEAQTVAVAEEAVSDSELNEESNETIDSEKNEEDAMNQPASEHQVTFTRGATTEVFKVTPQAPHQVIFTMTLSDWMIVETQVPTVEK